MNITTNFDEVVKQFKDFVAKREKELQKVAEITPRRLGQLIKNEVIESIRAEGLVASGDLLKSVSVTGLRASTHMSEASVGSSSPYAKFVEEGVRPGSMPPTAKIYQWMINKEGMEASESGAYLIARKIKEKGIPAKHPFAKGVEKANSKIDRELQIILNDTLRKG
ncbi:hypothetical protein BH09PAT1_BH09PAT1_8860 [soil metagenome]